MGNKPRRKMKNEIDKDLLKIKNEMKALKIEKGKDREAMKNKLAKNMFITKSK